MKSEDKCKCKIPSKKKAAGSIPKATASEQKENPQENSVYAADPRTLRKLANEGKFVAKVILAYEFLTGVKTPVDLEKARQLLVAAADDKKHQRHPACLYAKGECHLNNYTKDYPYNKLLAGTLILQSAKQGFAVAQFACAKDLLENKTLGTGSKAIEFARDAAIQGFSYAQEMLGTFHMGGILGIAQDAEKALTLLSAAYNKGHSSIPRYIDYWITSSASTKKSVSIDPDYPYAEKYLKALSYLTTNDNEYKILGVIKLKKIASFPRAQSTLGDCLLGGVGTEMNIPEAVECYKKSHNVHGFYMLAVCYANSPKEPEYSAKAVDYIEQAFSAFLLDTDWRTSSRFSSIPKFLIKNMNFSHLEKFADHLRSITHLFKNKENIHKGVPELSELLIAQNHFLGYVNRYICRYYAIASYANKIEAENDLNIILKEPEFMQANMLWACEVLQKLHSIGYSIGNAKANLPRYDLIFTSYSTFFNHPAPPPAPAPIPPAPAPMSNTASDAPILH